MRDYRDTPAALPGLDPSLYRVEWDEAPLDVPYVIDACECCGCVVSWFGGYFDAPRPARVVCTDCDREHGGEG